eukprot:7590430-Alexandrium_andersonii.AAC.1
MPPEPRAASQAQKRNQGHPPMPLASHMSGEPSPPSMRTLRSDPHAARAARRDPTLEAEHSPSTDVGQRPDVGRR